MSNKDMVKVEVIKNKFREWDINGTGFMPAAVFRDVLKRIGLPGPAADNLLQCMDGGSPDIVAYDELLDFIFTGAWRESQSSLRRERTASPKKRLEVVIDNQTAAGRGLRRAIRTLSKGRLRNAAEPTAALAEFCRETQVAEELRRKMQASLAAATLGEATSTEEVAAWEKFARWCVEQLLLEVFEAADLDESGKLSMEEVMVMFMLIAVQRNEGDGITPLDAEQVVREFDVEGDGKLNKAEFVNMVHALEREADLWAEQSDGSLSPKAMPSASQHTLPHLVLNFDVNNTVLISDSLTGADASKLISMTLAGSAWGIKHKKRGSTEPATWILIDHQPRAHPLWEGLVSYAQYVVELFPMPKGGEYDEIEAMKQNRRDALYRFCEPGQLGEALHPHMQRLLGALMSGKTKLLPSFFYLLNKLKRAGRSFSVVFRTFGIDVDEQIEREFNDFCEGRCPYFADDGLKLDGSDGGQDHRMNLSDPCSMGTFYRAPEDNSISLVWGTHQQPPKGQGFEFFEGIEGTRACVGADAAAASLRERVYNDRRTVVLRDYYPGWAKQGFASSGGKPIFVNIEDDTNFTIMFDDHTQPENPSIVDVIDVRDYPARVLMAQVYDIHVVKATPLRSIAEISYFWDELRRCETAKAAQLTRRRRTARMLHDVEAVRTAIALLGGAEGHDRQQSPEVSMRRPSLVHEAGTVLHYTAWHDAEAVKHCAPLPPDATEEPLYRQPSL